MQQEYIDKIAQFYDLLYLGFKFELAEQQLNHQMSGYPNKKLLVTPVANLTEETKTSAQVFIRDNKDFIINLLEHNLEHEKILALNISAAPLSFSQERLWFIEQYQGGSYNYPCINKLSNSVNFIILEQALQDTVKRHQILYTLLKTDADGYPYQEVCDIQNQPLLINKLHVANNNELEAVIIQQVTHTFCLDSEYPISISLIDQDNGDKYLSIVLHHVAFDGWSQDIFIRDLHLYYDHHLNKITNQDNETSALPLPLTLPKLGISYIDYTIWQQCYLRGSRLEHLLDYWINKLEGYTVLNLPLDNPRPLYFNNAGAFSYFTLDEITSNKLRNTAKHLQVSLYSLLLSSYNLFLKSYSNQNDIILGTPIVNRHHHQLENLVGFFVNTLALRSNIVDAQSLHDYIKQTAKDILDAQLHQEVPFGKLIDTLKIPKDTSCHPLFQVMFGVQRVGRVRQQLGLTGTKLNNHIFSFDQTLELGNLSTAAQFDLSTFIDDSETELTGFCNYATSIFNAASIKQQLKTFCHILGQIADLDLNPEIKIKQLSYLDISDYNQVIHVWNNQAEFLKNKQSSINCITPQTIHQLFEQQVYQTPDNIAIVYEDISLTYNELNIKTNQLAHYLKDVYKIRHDDLIALYLDRSEHMVIAMLATMKAGGAYVPIGTSYPIERTMHTLEQIGARVILANKIYKDHLGALLSRLKNSSPTSLECIDTIEFSAKLSSYALTNLTDYPASHNLVYIAYTSGTTGKPKGIMMPHGSAIIRITNLIDKFSLNQHSRFLFKTNYLFDVYFSDIFTTLSCGASLYITKHVFDIPEICRLIQTHQINICHFVPSQLEVIYDDEAAREIISHLNTINVSGEGFNKALVNENKSICYVNSYGPSEVGDTTVEITDLKANKISYPNLITIGQALPQIKLYILDDNLTPLPIGAIGELYIGGNTLARGYLNNPDLTTEKFISNPFQTETEKAQGCNARLYKSGDLVRYLPDSNIEYIGRNDFQVKIRGFRVELSEIEHVITTHELIEHAIVVIKPEMHDIIICYYTCREVAINADDLKNYAMLRLPDYMLPTHFIHIDSLPMTANGKLNKSALPDINSYNANASSYASANNYLEKQLELIFCQILKLNQISITDDFFHVGGNSLLAIRLVNKINHQLNCSLSVAQLFSLKTIKNIAHDFNELKLYTPTVILNNFDPQKPNMFLIHPGHAGCEVYYDLAKILEDKYNCYGIDNYNIYNSDKISSLAAIAIKYLDYISQIQPNGTVYNLLGWSLGGQIALQIAGILETQGHAVNLYLLDTFLPADFSSAYNKKDTQNNLNSSENNEKLFIKEITHKLINHGISEQYVNKVASALPSEYAIFNSPISTSPKMTTTKIKLFKAMNESATSTYPNNNLNLYITIPFEVIQINSNHYDILEIIIRDKLLFIL